MYIIKNAFINVTRMKGRNIVIALIITCITASACIALAIQKSGNQLIQSYQSSNPMEVSFRKQRMMPGENNTSQTTSESKALTVSDIKSYADSSYVSSYYYTLEASLSSSKITAVSDDDTTDEDNSDTTEVATGKEKFRANMGDYRITAYSDSSYIQEFIDGTKKMKEGTMFLPSNEANEIIISEALASLNSLKVGDEVTFYQPSDADTTYTFQVVGIYEDNTDQAENSFMKMNAMNSSNQIYTTIHAMEEILDSGEEQIGPNQGLQAKFYLNKASDLDSFTKEVKSKGLSADYEVQTNEQQLLETLTPIQQISKFSQSFLIVILVVGALILSVINLLHIRERKYEIGVLRSIGMSKWKVSIQIVTEIFMVALVSLMIGTGIGLCTSQPVTNYILKQQIEATKTQAETTMNNFGGEQFGRPGMNQKQNNSQKRNQNIDYVDTLKVQIDATTLLQLAGCSLLLVLVSSFISIMNINKYEPNKILQSRN